jgi:glycosyltransferase involved in cell wall biosynthesis
MTRPLVSAMLRIKNESRWIRDVLKPIHPLCNRVFIMDDHSTDNTAEVCREFPRVVLFESPFDSLDESRDKNWLYDRILEYPEYENWQWPNWLICIDGDEVLQREDIPRLLMLLAGNRENDDALAYRLQIIYLWGSENLRRIDGVYANFARPSIFKIFNPSFRFQKTPWGNGANFHCSSIPQELLYLAKPTDIRLIHLGYMTPEDRMRKWKWYNQIDPRNVSEGFDSAHPERGSYPHIVQGDIPEVPAHVRLMHAGPLQLEAIEPWNH